MVQLTEKNVRQIILGIIIGEDYEKKSKEDLQELLNKSNEIMGFLKKQDLLSDNVILQN